MQKHYKYLFVSIRTVIIYNFWVALESFPFAELFCDMQRFLCITHAVCAVLKIFKIQSFSLACTSLIIWSTYIILQYLDSRSWIMSIWQVWIMRSNEMWSVKFDLMIQLFSQSYCSNEFILYPLHIFKYIFHS